MTTRNARRGSPTPPSARPKVSKPVGDLRSQPVRGRETGAQRRLGKGYVDLQVNGYCGIDFNQEDVPVEQFHAACARLREDGVESVLATIITDHVDAMSRRLKRIVEARKRDPLVKQIIGGIHLEGPFISPVDGYRGAHPRDAVRSADVDAAKQLTAAAGGITRIVTLAPENDPGFKTTRYLAEQGIIVSAGHTDAPLDVLKGAIDAGLSMFTHLGNGCAIMMHRHDNIIQRALSLADRLWLCFIADGVHVPFHALRNYLQLAGERAIVVTDAMSAAGLGPGRFTVGRWDVVVGEDLAVWAPDRSHLIGSAMTMHQAEANLSKALGLPTKEIERLTSTNPRRALKLR